MHLVIGRVDELDDGENEVLGLVEREENLVARDGDRRRAGNAALHFDEAQLAGAGNAAFNVVTQLLEFAIGGIEAELALDVHDDGPGAGGADLCVCGQSGCGRCLAGHGLDQADRDHQHAAQYHWRQRRDLRFQFQVVQTFFEPPLQKVRALACLAGVEFGIGFPGLLLQFEFFGTVIPPGDFLGEAILDRGFSSGDQFEFAPTDLGKVFRHDLGDGVALNLFLQFARDPLAFGPVEDRFDAGFARNEWPIVEIGGA
ncbi:MAG: hypothetical protein AW07_03657 [Candidatus Accumulibacter sp. SK-11]|nr:MAG: hypothetical protein AW07_03657 [Candidatus Accumulibacter sp. SK-11]